MSIHNLNAPSQKKSFRQKTKAWRKDNIESAETLSYYNNSGVRQTIRNKVLNLNLYNGIIDAEDIANALNPDNIDSNFIPDNIPHIPIVVPKIKLLVGEELRRRFDFQVITTNADAISAKEESLKQFFDQKLVEILQANYSEQELEERLIQLEKERKYSWSDRREKMGNLILKHYWEELEFKKKLSEGFEGALVMGESLGQVDIINNEPTFELLNPLKVTSYKTGLSDRIEDSDMIVIEDHWAPGRIIDVFQEELKSSDIDEILDFGGTGANTQDNYSDDHNNPLLMMGPLENPIDGYDNFHNAGGLYNRNTVDSDGNVRVFRVYWKSYRKAFKVKYYNQDGDTEFRYEAEEYIVNKDLGEEIDKTLWLPEWWEGTKIGKDIYINMKPKRVQYNRLENPGACHPGIIGQVYNVNQGRAVSMIDRVKNLQYLYDAVTDRLNKGIASNHGKILEVDISKIPANWDIDKWLHYAFINKIAVVDGYKEGTQGAATGKLASGANQMGGQVLDMETGNYIQSQIGLLEFIEGQISNLTGISDQRQGQIDNRETARGVETSVTQSSHITEYWFAKHENWKTRVLAAFLETAKVALKGRSKKVQYILDDGSIEMLNIDGDAFAEPDYGLLVSNTNKNIEFEQTIKRYGELYIQRGGRLSSIMDLYFSSSMSDMRNKLEIAEETQEEAANKAAMEQMKADQQAAQAEMELKLKELELQKYDIDSRDQTKLAIANMSDDEVEEVEEGEDPIAREKLELDKFSTKKKLQLDEKALTNDMSKHDDKVKLEQKKISKMSTATTK